VELPKDSVLAWREVALPGLDRCRPGHGTVAAAWLRLACRVARTKRIPVDQRAEAVVIAWMRHQTTAYESMKIPSIKGKRREVRRMLAQRSKEVLGRYRSGEAVGEECLLTKALIGRPITDEAHEADQSWQVIRSQAPA
jgi:hypothetical protein